MFFYIQSVFRRSSELLPFPSPPSSFSSFSPRSKKDVNPRKRKEKKRVDDLFPNIFCFYLSGVPKHTGGELNNAPSAIERGVVHF
ncbi:hypothetical protein VNO78_31005 [Psophocarpus tetragonolobus]|uniref:Uncharacterized protein n=1 Tax=Psophocarpus tetragonolobus TaxID=3891 RepID=A0AAN9X6S0_PSOTE